MECGTMLVTAVTALSGAIVFLYLRAEAAEKKYVGELKSQLDDFRDERAIMGGTYDSNAEE